MDPDGKEDNKPSILIVDMPGMTDPNGKLSSKLLRIRLSIELGKRTGLENILINVVDGESVNSFKAALNDKTNTNGLKSVIFIGGHSHIFESEIIGKLSNNDINLDNDIQLYFATCETGLNSKELSRKLGVPVENVHLNEGTSWSDNSLEFLNKVLSGKNIEESFEQYKQANMEKNNEVK